jgi:ribose 5-phosphate isomerase B
MSLLVVGADHGGFHLKEELKKAAEALGWSVKDIGTHGTEPVDYPDYAHRVALEVLAAEGALGLMVDGAGVGSAMAACKVPGIRAAVCNELYTARNAREHNHANVLCLGSQVIGPGVAREVLRAFLTTQPGGERHARRVQKIRDVEQTYAGAAAPAGLIDRIVRIVLEMLGQRAQAEAPAAAEARRRPVKATPGGEQRAARSAFRPVLSERDVLAADRTRPLSVAPGTLVTPQARDTARALGLEILHESRR